MQDEWKERLGCVLAVAVWLSLATLIIAAPWVVLTYFGPGWSILYIVVIHIVWLALVGIPAPASGSKVASCGCLLIVLSSIPALIVDIVMLCRENWKL